MMLDVDFAELKSGMAEYLPVGALIGLILLVEMGLVFGQWVLADTAPEVRDAAMPAPSDVGNTTAIGQIVYDQYIYMFQAAGLILLVAMVGAIVLTLRHREGIKRQDILAQMYRTREASVELKDVKPGQGI
ncbi:MAG: NADH-quinone oxidoreductase subunit J, partial [Pseudomonadota bacterium]